MRVVIVAVLCLVGAAWAGDPEVPEIPPSVRREDVKNFLEAIGDGPLRGICLRFLHDEDALALIRPPPEEVPERSKMARLLERYLNSRSKRAAGGNFFIKFCADLLGFPPKPKEAATP